MAILTSQLLIVQGATFRQPFICSLADIPSPPASIQAFATTGNTFTLSVGLKGDSNFVVVANGTLSVVTNTVTLDIDEAITAAISARSGRYTVEVSNGTDRWRIMEGAWRLDRDTA